MSEKVEQLRHKIQSQMTLLRPRFTSPDGNGEAVSQLSLGSVLSLTRRQLRESIETAAAVASSMSINRYFQIPQAVSSIFTGRSALLEELKTALNVSSLAKNSHTQKRFVLYGLGGSGKTQFCCKFAQDNQNE
jgi:hypothetical protein